MTTQIETKFSIGDAVFFIKDDKIQAGEIYKMDVTFDEKNQSICIYSRGEGGEISVIAEHRAFASREQLIQSL